MPSPRRAAENPAGFGVAPSPALARWAEPTRSLSLRWGSYTSRYLCGLALITSSTVGILGANTYTVYLLVAAIAAHVAGWVVLPAAGIRRSWIAVPSLGAIFALLTGPQSVPGLTAVLLAWLIARHRPALSYVVVLPAVVVGLLLAGSFRDFGDMPLAFGVMAVATIGCAWLGRALAPFRFKRIPSNPAASAE